MTLEPAIAIRAIQILLGAGILLQAIEVLATRSGHALLCMGNRPYCSVAHG